MLRSSPCAPQAERRGKRRPSAAAAASTEEFVGRGVDVQQAAGAQLGRLQGSWLRKARC
jgi:hypothetical protein